MFGITCFDSQGNSINHLTQWDLNQQLHIYDWGYDELPIFHYCNKDSRTALVVPEGQFVEIGDSTVLNTFEVQGMDDAVKYIAVIDDEYGGVSERSDDGAEYKRTGVTKGKKIKEVRK